MAITDVEICNLALDNIGTKNIVSRDSTEKPAKLCDRWYDVARRSVLKDLNASFSIKRATLATVSGFTPVYGYPNAFTLPDDCLKILNIGDPMQVERYQIEGNYLYCDYETSVNVRYIYDCEDVSLYDDEFIELIALKLARCICMPLTQDIEKSNNLEMLYKQKYLETSTKYGNDNKVIIINKPRYRGHKVGYCGDSIR
ncbi:MAG: hypothetical protein WCG95_00065 [bacterium]